MNIIKFMLFWQVHKFKAIVKTLFVQGLSRCVRERKSIKQSSKMKLKWTPSPNRWQIDAESRLEKGDAEMMEKVPKRKPTPLLWGTMFHRNPWKSHSRNHIKKNDRGTTLKNTAKVSQHGIAIDAKSHQTSIPKHVWNKRSWTSSKIMLFWWVKSSKPIEKTMFVQGLSRCVRERKSIKWSSKMKLNSIPKSMTNHPPPRVHMSELKKNWK